MQKQYLKTILNLTFDVKFIIFILIQFLPIQELNSEEWEEKRQNIKFLENSKITDSPQWQKIETNEGRYQQRILWDKIDTKNHFKGEDYNFNKDSNKLLENSENSKI